MYGHEKTNTSSLSGKKTPYKNKINATSMSGYPTTIDGSSIFDNLPKNNVSKINCDNIYGQLDTQTAKMNKE